MEDTKTNLYEEFTQWEKKRNEYMKKNPERRKVYKNDLGHLIEPLYTPLSLENKGFEYLQDLGLPGQYPYTRGHTPNMNRSSHLNVGCYSGFGTPDDSRERYEKIISWGCDVLEMAWDLPTQIGYDSDHIMATGEVGRTGVAVDSLADMELMFKNLPLNEMGGLNLLSNSMGPIGLGLIIALGEKQGLKPNEFMAYMQNDPLKEFAARGTYIFPVKPSVKLACDVVEWCINNAPHWKPINFCSNHINAAGAGSCNAAAFAMANGFVYIDELISRGYTIDEIVPLTRFFLDEREDFFAMVALGRATRKVWAEFMCERYGASPDSPAARMDFEAYSHGGETLQEPLNNVLRIGYAALGYYLGGVTHLYNAGFDEAMGLTNETTCKLSIRTSQIINNELGFSKTIDPLAGSYYVESLTMDMARDIKNQVEHVLEKYGDSHSALMDGYVQGIISRGAIRRQSEFESGERVFCGLNIYPTDEDLPLGAFRLDSEKEKQQKIKLAQLRENRDNAAVNKALKKLQTVSESNGNTVEAVVEALKVYATVGEICDIWRKVYGEYQAMTIF